MKTFERNKEGRYEVATTAYKKIQADEWRNDLPIEGCKIPVVTSLPKHEKVEKIGYQILARLKRVDEILHDNIKGKFKTLSDVYRAAHYIGTMVLFRMYEDQIPYRGKAYYDMMRTVTAHYDDIDMVDMLVFHAGSLMERIADGSKTHTEVEFLLASMVATLPSDLQPKAKARLQKLSLQMTQQEFQSMKTGWQQESVEEVVEKMSDAAAKVADMNKL